MALTSDDRTWCTLCLLAGSKPPLCPAPVETEGRGVWGCPAFWGTFCEGGPFTGTLAWAGGAVAMIATCSSQKLACGVWRDVEEQGIEGEDATGFSRKDDSRRE